MDYFKKWVDFKGLYMSVNILFYKIFYKIII